MVAKEQNESKSEGVSDDIIYRIDVPANRYDLLCLEGLVDALLVFQKKYIININLFKLYKINFSFFTE